MRAAEEAGTWPDRVLAVLSGLPLGGLDLPESLGGVSAGCIAKMAVLEALAGHDAGGLPASDQPGPAVGAVLACPDAALAKEVAAAARAVRPAAPWQPSKRTSGCRAGWRGFPPIRLRPGSGSARPTICACCGSKWTAPATRRRTRYRSPSTPRARPRSSLADAEVVGRWPLVPGTGLEVRGRARLWAAAVALGVARAALTSTLAYTTERQVFGKPVAHHQGNAFDLARAAAGVHAAGLCVRDAAARFDGYDPDSGFWATEAWVETIETAVAVTDLGIQLLGGHGFLMDHLAEKRFREARMLGLLFGGRDAADADLAAAVLDVADPILPAARS